MYPWKGGGIHPAESQMRERVSFLDQFLPSLSQQRMQSWGSPMRQPIVPFWDWKVFYAQNTTFESIKRELAKGLPKAPWWWTMPGFQWPFPKGKRTLFLRSWRVAADWRVQPVRFCALKVWFHARQFDWMPFLLSVQQAWLFSMASGNLLAKLSWRCLCKEKR